SRENSHVEGLFLPPDGTRESAQPPASRSSQRTFCAQRPSTPQPTHHTNPPAFARARVIVPPRTTRTSCVFCLEQVPRYALGESHKDDFGLPLCFRERADVEQLERRRRENAERTWRRLGAHHGDRASREAVQRARGVPAEPAALLPSRVRGHERA